MFTGIVQAVGSVVSLTRQAFGAHLVIDPQGWPYRPAPGDSIAVHGCCLTHAPREGDGPTMLCFDMVHQTLDRTTLGRLRAGDAVNLEACLTPDSSIGGHFVQGHIDGVGRVASVRTGDGAHRLTLAADEAMIRTVIPTGSVAVDGVSLTIAHVNHDQRLFTVALIPTTLRATTLGRLKPDDPVNIETDILARTVIYYLDHFSPRAAPPIA